MTERIVPAIDVSGFASGDDDVRDAIADAVRSACRDTGFLIIGGVQGAASR